MWHWFQKNQKMGGQNMAEKKDVEINSRADTIDLMHPSI